MNTSSIGSPKRKLACMEYEEFEEPICKKPASSQSTPKEENDKSSWTLAEFEQAIPTFKNTRDLTKMLAVKSQVALKNGFKTLLVQFGDGDTLRMTSVNNATKVKSVLSEAYDVHKADQAYSTLLRLFPAMYHTVDFKEKKNEFYQVKQDKVKPLIKEYKEKIETVNNSIITQKDIDAITNPVEKSDFLLQAINASLGCRPGVLEKLKWKNWVSGEDNYVVLELDENKQKNIHFYNNVDKNDTFSQPDFIVDARLVPFFLELISMSQNDYVFNDFKKEVVNEPRKDMSNLLIKLGVPAGQTRKTLHNLSSEFQAEANEKLSSKLLDQQNHSRGVAFSHYSMAPVITQAKHDASKAETKGKTH